MGKGEEMATRQAPARAKCTFRSKHGSKMDISGDIPTAIEMGFFYLDTPQQRDELLTKLTHIHEKLCNKGE